MPHLRIRYAKEILLKIAAFSPLVGVLGHRQVGKTTLLESVCSDYHTLDSSLELSAAHNRPEEYIRNLKGHLIGIDECQLEPSLFPALKEHVRRNKAPGQFIMSGSVRFTSRKAIRESLTGRIINLEVFPFTVSEMEELPLASFCRHALEHRTLENLVEKAVLTPRAWARRMTLIENYYDKGGLPGICFIRDETLRKRKISDQLDTILDRDLRLIVKTTLAISDIKNFCAILARYQGKPLEIEQLHRESGISVPTIKKLFYALEAVFLIRLVRIEGGRKGHTVFFEDQGEAQWLAQVPFSVETQMLHFCFNHVRTQFSYLLGESVQEFQYRTRGGAVVPLAYRNKKGTLGIIPIQSASDATSALGSANSFLKTYTDSKILLVHNERTVRLLNSRVMAIPLTAVTV